MVTVDMKYVCSRRKREAGNDNSTYEESINIEEFNASPKPIPNAEGAVEPTGGRRDDQKVDGGKSILRQLQSLNLRSKIVARSLSLEDGKRRCTEALRLSFAYDLCSSRVDTAPIVDTCALDVKLLNDYRPSKSAPTQLEIACLDNIRQSLESLAPTEVLQFKELKKLLTRVENLGCPSQCNQKGQCANAKCQCNEGYMGTDCSLRRGQIPTVERIFAPVCDIRKHPCKHIHLVATDLTIPEDVTCKMRCVNGSFGDVPEIQYSTPVISGGLVECLLPSMPISRDSTGSIVYMVQVSISNDAQRYSQELPFTVFDGHCMQCPASQDSPCQIKENACAIEERCYNAGDKCSSDETKICDPAKCHTKWSSEGSVNCDDGFESCP